MIQLQAQTCHRVVYKLLLLVRTSRPGTSAITIVLSTLILVVGTGLSASNSFVRGLPILFVTMSGFVINDIFDRHKDRMGGKDRPVATGLVSPAEAAFFAILLLTLGGVMEWMEGNVHSFQIIIATVAGVILYSPTARLIPVSKGFFTGLLCCAPLYYAASIGNMDVPLHLGAIVICFIVGRELILDTIDLEGDINFRVRTVPYYLGPSVAAKLGWVLMLTAVVCAIVSTRLDFYRALAILAGILIVLAATLWPRSPSVSVRLTRLVMVLGVIAVSGSFAIAQHAISP